MYVSGDNASLDVVRAIVDRLGYLDSAVLFAGAARTPLLGEAHLTLTGRGAAEAATVLDARRVLPVHVDSWTHFSEGVEPLRRAFTDAGIADQLVLAEPGTTVSL